MSLKKLHKHVLVQIIGLVCLAIAVAISIKPEKKKGYRELASKEYLQITQSGKQLRFASVKVEAPHGIPEDDESELVLEGKIMPLAFLSGELEYEWSIPEGVKIVEGQLADSLPGIKPQEQATVRLVVTGASREIEKLISLKAFIKMDDKEKSSTFVFNTKPENTLENYAAKMAEAVENAKK